MTTVDIHIEGMTCRHCIDAVEGSLAQVEGLQVDEVGIGRARVRYEGHEVSPDALTEAVEDAGYSVQSVERVA